MRKATCVPAEGVQSDLTDGPQDFSDQTKALKPLETCWREKARDARPRRVDNANRVQRDIRICEVESRKVFHRSGLTFNRRPDEGPHWSSTPQRKAQKPILAFCRLISLAVWQHNRTRKCGNSRFGYAKVILSSGCIRIAEGFARSTFGPADCPMLQRLNRSPAPWF